MSSLVILGLMYLFFKDFNESMWNLRNEGSEDLGRLRVGGSEELLDFRDPVDVTELPPFIPVDEFLHLAQTLLPCAVSTSHVATFVFL
jgi:hypothetical protein